MPVIAAALITPLQSERLPGRKPASRDFSARTGIRARRASAYALVPHQEIRWLYGRRASSGSVVGSDPLNYLDPTGLDIHVVTVTDGGLGVHSALYIDPGPGRPGGLYDPGGSFGPEGPGSRGSGGFMEGGGELLSGFIGYETREGQKVSVVRIATTPIEEAAILSRIGGWDAPDPGPGFCANAVGAVTNGIGPFARHSLPVLPGTMRARALDAAKRAGGAETNYARDRGGRPVPVGGRTIP